MTLGIAKVYCVSKRRVEAPGDPPHQSRKRRCLAKALQTSLPAKMRYCLVFAMVVCHSKPLFFQTVGDLREVS